MTLNLCQCEAKRIAHNEVPKVIKKGKIQIKFSLFKRNIKPSAHNYFSLKILGWNLESISKHWVEDSKSSKWLIDYLLVVRRIILCLTLFTFAPVRFAIDIYYLVNIQCYQTFVFRKSCHKGINSLVKPDHIGSLCSVFLPRQLGPWIYSNSHRNYFIHFS